MNSTKNNGSTLVLTVVFIAISTILAAGILRAASSHRIVGAAQLNLEQAMYAAEAALEEAAQVLSDQSGFMNSAVTHGSGTVDGGAFDYRIQQIAGWKQFSLHVTGTVNGVSRKIDIERAYFPTFANFAMWSVVNGVIYYFPGEVFDGLIHSDDKLWFSSNSTYGGPVFSNKVTSGATTYGGDTSYVDFQDGFHLDVENGSMASVDFDFLRARSDVAGLTLEGKTTLTFNNDQVLVTNERMGWVDHAVTLQPDQLIYVANSTWGTTSTRSGKVHLEGGNLDGRLTIASENDMYVHSHLRYANDPRNDDAAAGDVSDDALGLISKDDIWVDTDAPNNLDIFGAILATGQYSNNPGSFGVLNYHTGAPRGDLTIHGSLVQDTRGAVNTSNWSGLATGYAKKYGYDPRFQTASPPYYPEIGNRVEFVGWLDAPVN